MKKKKKEPETKVEKIIEQLLFNKKKICNEINDEIERRNESIIQYMSSYIADMYGERVEEFDEYLPVYGSGSYWKSYEIEKYGKMSPSTTVNAFINAYDGAWDSANNSWYTYSDDISEEMSEIGDIIVKSVLDRRIAEIDDLLTEAEREELYDEIPEDFYEDSKACELGIGVDFGIKIMNMSYNDFVMLSKEKRDILEEDEDYECGYEYFYNRFYAANV